jgi:RNA polymerase sigma-70 factor (ECF subfamily)
MSSDHEQLRSEIARLLPRLRRFGVALTGSQEDGDDMVQAALTNALGRETKMPPMAQADTWLFGMIQTLWRDELRRRKTNGTKSAATIAGAEKSVDGRRITETLLMLAQTRERFGRLPEDQRVALALVVLDGMSYRDAAAQLDIPVGTLMSRLSRARDALRTMIDESKGYDPSLKTAAGE